MKYIERNIKETIINSLKPQKVMVLTGARRVGKTVLLKKISEELKEKILLLNGEDMEISELLQRRSIQHYKYILGSSKILFIDEAHRIDNIGRILKLMVDEIEGLQVLISGSSALNMMHSIAEPLTGRMQTFSLFPIAESELSSLENTFQRKDNLSNRLVFGNYPELFHMQDNEEKHRYLKDLVNSYLLKDIFTYENIKNASKIYALLRLIAFQVGSEVSYQELGNQLAMSKNTVERYLDLLAKAFILYKLSGFSSNLRKEVTKNSKWYFYDNGMRNILIANLNPVIQRSDIGILWENYILSERIKFQNYSSMLVNNYFWRTYDRQEIDWIEERGGKLYAYEMKWKFRRVRTPAGWEKAYPEAEYRIIHSDNYHEWIMQDD
jgi:predicted AAA+ superfamily ATPase